MQQTRQRIPGTVPEDEDLSRDETTTDEEQSSRALTSLSSSYQDPHSLSTSPFRNNNNQYQYSTTSSNHYNYPVSSLGENSSLTSSSMMLSHSVSTGSRRIRHHHLHPDDDSSLPSIDEHSLSTRPTRNTQDTNITTTTSASREVDAAYGMPAPETSLVGNATVTRGWRTFKYRTIAVFVLLPFLVLAFLGVAIFLTVRARNKGKEDCTMDGTVSMPPAVAFLAPTMAPSSAFLSSCESAQFASMR